MESVLEGDAAQAAARERLPDLIELARQARVEAPASGGAPAEEEASATATAPADVRYLAPARTGAVPGVWQAPAPPPPPPGWQPQPRVPARAPLDRSSWPGAEVVRGERDTAQRIGDRLYPLVERIRDSRAGWVGVIALAGITVPIILLRQDFDVRLRLVLSFFTVIFWLQLLSELFGG